METTDALVTLGKRIRRLRGRMGLNQTELAQKTLTSKSTIGRVENGEATLDSDQVQRIDDALEADGALVELWALAQSGSVSSAAMAEMERNASVINDWDLRAVCGLLMTPAYQRGFMTGGRVAPERIDKEIAIRVERQRILVNPLVTSWFIIDQSVLLRPYGGRAAMCEQLLHLEEVAQYSNVFIQVMPYNSTGHPGGEGPIRVLEYRDKPPVWYTEGIWSGRMTADREEVANAMANFNIVRASALPPDQSAGFIETIRTSHYE
jgi:transcriptional regulator with XRE-family HTH domain